MSKEKLVVENEVPANAGNLVDQMVEGLESEDSNDLLNADALATDPNVANYKSREWLEANEPTFPVELTSKKFDAEREPKVQAGLQIIAELMGGKINPLVLLLGKWWEVKPARASIKDMIDAEAEVVGRPSDHYLQIDLRENVDKLSQLQNAVDRLRYSITYFKPRAGLSSKEVYKQFSIMGIVYNVPLSLLTSAKVAFPDPADKAKLYEMIIAGSTKVEAEEL